MQGGTRQKDSYIGHPLPFLWHKGSPRVTSYFPQYKKNTTKPSHRYQYKNKILPAQWGSCAGLETSISIPKPNLTEWSYQNYHNHSSSIFHLWTASVHIFLVLAVKDRQKERKGDRKRQMDRQPDRQTWLDHGDKCTCVHEQWMAIGRLMCSFSQNQWS